VCYDAISGPPICGVARCTGRVCEKCKVQLPRCPNCRGLPAGGAPPCGDVAAEETPPKQQQAVTVTIYRVHEPYTTSPERLKLE